jgi:hypothetical protein
MVYTKNDKHGSSTKEVDWHHHTFYFRSNINKAKGCTASVLVQKLTSVTLFQSMVSPFVSSKEWFIAMFSSKCSIIVGSGWVVSIMMPFDFVILDLCPIKSTAPYSGTLPQAVVLLY